MLRLLLILLWAQYYSDFSHFYVSRFLSFGGKWDDGSVAGVIALLTYVSSSDHRTDVGSYYSDSSALYASRFLLFSECWAGGSTAGMFYLSANNGASHANSYAGSETTYYSDYCDLIASGIINFGAGVSWGGSSPGIFCFSMDEKTGVSYVGSYYSDYSYLYASRCLCFGEHWGHGSNAGMFHFNMYTGVSDTYSFVGSTSYTHTSETTYYSDHSLLSASRFPLIGGDWGYGSRAGMFFLDVNYGGVSSTASNLGSMT